VRTTSQSYCYIVNCPPILEKKHVSFQSAWDNGGELADAELARSMFHRAQGYSHKAEKIQFLKVGDGVELCGRNNVEHYPPDTAAGVFPTYQQTATIVAASRSGLGEEGDVAGQVVVRVIGGLPDAVEAKK